MELEGTILVGSGYFKGKIGSGNEDGHSLALNLYGYFYTYVSVCFGPDVCGELMNSTSRKKTLLKMS